MYSSTIIAPKGNSDITLSSHNDDTTVGFPDIGFDFYYIGTTTLTFENNKSYAFISGQEQGKTYVFQEGS